MTRIDLILGRRVLRNGLVLATTLITCTALQANDKEKERQSSGAPPTTERSADRAYSGERQGKVERKGELEHEDKQHMFVHKAMMFGEMEVRMGELAQQKGQSQDVKNLGQTLVRDHTKANQQLQQIAQSLNISSTDDHTKGGELAEKHKKHQQHLSDLQGKSGSEFDKEFVRMAIKGHKKSIAAFEECQGELKDTQLTSFIQQTLPTLRQHLQMAQAAARTVGVDESTIAIDQPDTGTAAGAPAAGETGRYDRQIDTDVDVDVDRNDVDLKTETDKDGKVFQKGDGKVLGLPTSKTDGKYLGIPKPGGKKDSDADISVEADVDRDSSVGAPARNESDASDKNIDVDVDVDKK
jgi:putative membrane protein